MKKNDNSFPKSGINCLLSIYANPFTKPYK